MFTGLVQGMGQVAAVEETADGVRLLIAGDFVLGLDDGDSVAVNGVCLTAVRPTDCNFFADVMHETLRRSSLGVIAPGARVNLELPLRPEDRLGGHFVQGHVDGIGTVAAVEQDGFARVIRIAAAPDLLRYVVEKGSIAIDGVSLTVAAVDGDSLSVSLIPETLERTTLGAAEPGTTVNLEVDVLAKYVEKLVAR
jgi:riboflavin synthase